jgi:hypothetical protein
VPDSIAIKGASADGQWADAIGEALAPLNPAFPKEEVATAIVEGIRVLRACDRDHFGRKAVIQTRDNARDLRKLAEQLKRKLERARTEISARLDLDQSVSDLDRISQACRLAETESLTEGLKAQTKNWCAKIGWTFQVKFSIEPPTIESLMKVAPLLYEAATGKRPTDLRRACAACIKTAHALRQT